jgi:tRNA A-37 threonylcarbamoyl transferase component Bud32
VTGRIRFTDGHVERDRTTDDERKMMAEAAAAGCAPDFEVIEGEPTKVRLLTIRMKRFTMLGEWLEGASPERKRELARSLLECVRRLHALGICHQDLHVDNVAVDGTRPLLIDFELALRTSSDQPCYDLVGPASGVPVHERHLFKEITEGVWWDSSTTQVRTIGRYLGSVEEADAQHPA